MSQLLFLEAEETSKPIHLYINSPGGSVTAGLAIYDTVSNLLASWRRLELTYVDIDAGESLPYYARLLANAMYQYVSSPIHTYCVGQAASMGSLLLAAGEKGKRHALPNSSIMIHRTLSAAVL